MAKAKNPFLSLEASGSVADSITTRQSKGQTIVSRKLQRQDTHTADQQSWRTMVEMAIALWHALSLAERETWNRLAAGKAMTGYNLFLSQALRPNPGIYLPLLGGTMQGAIAMGGYGVTGLPAPAGAQDADTLLARNTAITAALYTQGARVYNDADISIPNEGWNDLNFNTERYDTDGIHEAGANNHKLTCKTPGKYIVVGNASFNVNAVGVRSYGISLNGGNWIGFHNVAAYADFYTTGHVTTIWNLALNDYVSFQVYQNSGGALLIKHNHDYSPEFMMQRIG